MKQPPSRRQLFVRCAVITLAVALVIGAMFAPGVIKTEHLVDPAQVCIDSPDGDYAGAFNLSDDVSNPNPFMWQCYKVEEEDLTPPESNLNIEAWCLEHHDTRDTTVRDGQWYCVDYRFW